MPEQTRLCDCMAAERAPETLGRAAPSAQARVMAAAAAATASSRRVGSGKTVGGASDARAAAATAFSAYFGT